MASGEARRSENAAVRLGLVRLLRAWSTISLSEDPGVVADDAVKQARLWAATGHEGDARFRVEFGVTYSDADMAVVGREENLLPVLTDLAHQGFRYHVDARTEADARWLEYVYGEGGSREWVFLRVEHDADGDWRLDGEEEAV